jgi:hypothetical protein
MKIKILLHIYFFFVALPVLSGQKNALTFVYTPAITKMKMTDVREFGDNVFSDAFDKLLYETKKPTQSEYGYNLGFTYQRKVKKITIEFGFSHTILRTNSGFFYQIKGITDYPINYGGMAYNLTYEGIEVPLNMYFEIHKKDRLTIALNTGLSFNLLGQFRLEYHSIDRTSGMISKLGSYTYINDPRFEYYVTKLHERRNQRIGFCIGVKFDYQLLKHLSVSASPIIKYYSNALEITNSADSPRFDAFFFGLQSQINFNF